MSNKTRYTFLTALTAIFIVGTAPASAQSLPQSPHFKLPIDCTLGTDCWIVNYVDTDPSDQARDFTCAVRSYDGHKGVDFGLRSLAEMKAGVDVLAPLAGTVLRIRDGEDDSTKTESDLDAIKESQKECGNGILIDHSAAGFPGLRSMYCHLKNGSITVAAKDVVTAGQKIAQVGQSGYSEFPHLHFGVIWEEAVMDPFTGLDNTKGCGQMATNMWDSAAAIQYQTAAIYDFGFENKIPDFEALKSGAEKPETLSSASNAFIFWAGFYGVQQGDEIHLVVTNEKGETALERTTIQDENRARQFYYTGRKIKDGVLPAGHYTGIATLKREGQAPLTRQTTITVR